MRLGCLARFSSFGLKEDQAQFGFGTMQVTVGDDSLFGLSGTVDVDVRKNIHRQVFLWLRWVKGFFRHLTRWTCWFLSLSFAAR